jgi:hypothetical protein
MNLLDRIERRLDDTRFRLQPLDFEACATSLISYEYTGLAPITGGTDHGLDAELVKPNGQVVGLIVTSSRTWEGAKRSLRGSLKSAREHRRPVHQVLVANLAEINRQKRTKLAALTSEFDCELIQVYDRAWFANAFIAHPEWRQKILRIPGGAFSLSRAPRGARPDERHLPTVGRDELLATASSAEEDLVLWGVPGAGKSHVAGRLPGALFLEQHTPPERLLDDLLSTTPQLVVVDDAGARADDLERLLHARRAENLTFRVAATCWPHEKETVTDHLPGALTLEVDLLTREEIGTLLRERGITRTSVLAHLLEQAQGRPAWALNLADLLVGQGDWQSVWTGQALREQIRAFLRRSQAPAEAIHLLAAVALVGEANEDQARTLADLFRLSPIQFDELIRSVAIAGLVDVRRMRVWGRGSDGPSFEDSYRVVPRTIAGSIVADVYFAGRATPVRIRDIKAALPELTAGILQTQIYAALLGATEPLVPTTAELLDVLPAMTSTPEGDELLRTYALIGPECARFVFEYLESVVRDAANSDDEQSAVSATTVLASRLAGALLEEDSEPVRTLFDALALLASREWDYKTPIETLVEDVQDARTGDAPTPTAIMHLAAAMGSKQAEKLSDQVWLKLAAEVLKPTFDGNYMSPEKANQFVMRSFTWPAEVMDALFNALQPELATRIARASNANLETLIDLVNKWVGIANSHGLPFGGIPSAEQEASGRRIAQTMASEMAPRITTPGLRACFNRVASGVGVTLDEPDDLFAALTAERDVSEDWEEDRRRRDTELDEALASYLQKPPKVLMEWLVRHEADLAMVKNGTAGWQVMARLAMHPHPEVWLQAALDHGLGRTVSPLVGKCVDLGLMTLPMAIRLLQDPGCRAALVPAVISACHDADIVNLVANDLSADDIQNLDSSYAIRHASDLTREALFTHPDPVIRSNAAALWAAEWSIDANGMPEDPNWAIAMSDLVVPSTSMRDYMQSQALKFLAETAPTTYMNLLVKHVEALEGSDDFDEWEESVRQLSGADRVELWKRVRGSPMANNLFWVIAAGDVDWIAAAVSDPRFPVPLSQLLHATRFQHGRRYPLRTLAVMLRPLKWQPDDLLWTLEVGTHWGEEHERLARHVEICRELAASPESDLARLGARGLEIYEPRMIEARAAARRAALRGTLGH